MYRQKTLAKLQNAFENRIVRLERLSSSLHTTQPDADRIISYVVIESLNCWASFSREYYLSCAILSASTINGTSSGPLVRYTSERDAILAAISLLKPHIATRVAAGTSIANRDEPTWHEPNTLIKLASSYTFINASQINSAFSYTTTFFRDAPPIRNFFAHRNKASAAKVASLANSSPYFSSEKVAHKFLGDLMPGRAQSILAEWIDDLRLVSHEICL